MFNKTWIYERGGRPVIYQPEWRICCEDMPFTSAEAVIVVPNESWADELRRIHRTDQDMVVERYSTAMEPEEAEVFREPFQWRVMPIE